MDYRLGVITVVLGAGCEGLLLLNERHPARASGNSRAIRVRRIGVLPLTIDNTT